MQNCVIKNNYLKSYVFKSCNLLKPGLEIPKTGSNSC